MKKQYPAYEKRRARHRNMITRCYRPWHKDYKYYGARGIEVCDRWRFGDETKTGFECFIADMGEPPTSDHTVDRINNNGPYSPENCRWATRAEQMRNRRYRAA